VRIVHVTRQFHPARGGLETVVESLAKHQAASGHDVQVVTLNRQFGTGVKLPASEWLGPVKVVRIPYWGSQRYPVAPTVLTHIADADVVHVHAIDFFFDFLALTQSFHRRTLIVSTHGGFFHTDFASRLKKIYFALVTRASIGGYAFVAASSNQDFELFSRIRRRGIETVLNGVDCEKFANLGPGEGCKQLIYFGRFAPNKNLFALFPFLRALRAKEPGWRLVLAGRPLGVTSEQLREEARRCGVEDCLALMESPSDEALREAVRASSVFVSPSRYEGFGIAAIEAMSGGLLPILSDISAHRETVATTGLGVLTDFSRPEEAACATLAAWRQWQGRECNQAALEERLAGYSWKGAARRFDEIYRRVRGQNERRIVATRVQVTSAETTIGVIDDCIADRSPLRISFVNANLANEAAADPNVAEALEGFHLLNDGIGLDLASFMLFGRFFPANLNGTDFTPAYLDRSRHKLRLYLLGAAEQVVAEAAEIYRRRWPRHQVVGFHNGFFAPEEARALADRVRAARPDIVLVAMGNPLQEFWLAENIPRVCPVGMAVGSLFNFQTGKVPRAPPVVQKARLEWFYRLLIEPRRLWRRYTVGNALFLSRVALQYMRGERA
jgi:alpha-1,3-mannosyltransferase